MLNVFSWTDGVMGITWFTLKTGARGMVAALGSGLGGVDLASTTALLSSVALKFRASSSALMAAAISAFFLATSAACLVWLWSWKGCKNQQHYFD